MIKTNKYIFSKSKKLGAANIEYVDLNKDEISMFKIVDFIKTEASKLIKEGDIAVIKTKDVPPCYLPNLLKDPFQVETLLKDNYNN